MILKSILRSNKILYFSGCHVVGFAGTDEKCEYLQKKIGFDHVYNYKTVNIKASLREGAPKRVDCYFDNVRTYKILIYISVYDTR